MSEPALNRERANCAQPISPRANQRAHLFFNFLDLWYYCPLMNSHKISAKSDNGNTSKQALKYHWLLEAKMKVKL